MQPWLDDRGLADAARARLARCRARFPRAPVADIERLLDRGISGQTRFQNNTVSPFSYAMLDGFDVPLPLVHVFDRPRESLRSIELFTDGYFKPAATPESSHGRRRSPRSSASIRKRSTRIRRSRAPPGGSEPTTGRSSSFTCRMR